MYFCNNVQRNMTEIYTSRNAFYPPIIRIDLADLYLSSTLLFKVAADTKTYPWTNIKVYLHIT